MLTAVLLARLITDDIAHPGLTATLKTSNIRDTMTATWVQLEALVQQYFFNAGGEVDTASTSYLNNLGYDNGYDLGYDLGYDDFGPVYPDGLDLAGGMPQDIEYGAYLDYIGMNFDSTLMKGQSINRRLLRGKKQ